MTPTDVLGCFRTSTMHPQLVRVIKHALDSGLLSYRWLDEHAAFVDAVSSPSTPLVCACAVLRDCMQGGGGGGHSSTAAFTDPSVALSALMVAWYEEQRTRYEAAEATLAAAETAVAAEGVPLAPAAAQAALAARGVLQLFASACMVPPDPRRVTHNDLTQYFAHTIEYADFPGQACPCASCLKQRFCAVHSERMFELARGDAFKAHHGEETQRAAEHASDAAVDEAVASGAALATNAWQRVGGAVRADWASSHARTSGLSPSSRPRNGSATRWPRRISTGPSAGVAGGSGTGGRPPAIVRCPAEAGWREPRPAWPGPGRWPGRWCRRGRART